MFVKPANWNKLTPEEKKKLRMDYWESAEGVQFVSPEAEKGYRERAKRLRACYDLSYPDRPVADVGAAEYACRRAGLDGMDMLYHHEKMVEPLVKFHEEFEPDVAGLMFPYPGTVFDLLDLKTYDWTGHPLPKHQLIQMVEKEYMTADEYTAFTADPTGWFQTKYIPRMFGNLGGLAFLPDFARVTEIVDVMWMVAPFGIPQVQETLKTLMHAGEEMLKILGVFGSANLAGHGFPGMTAGFGKVPFDFLGDTLRGTKGIMMDMYRHPKELQAACEAYVPLLAKQLAAGCDAAGAPVIMYPLHKGADGFMSMQQFDKFYWPTMKGLFMELWEKEGIMASCFVEGSYNHRLERLAEMPKGSCHWWFDQTDMRKVKECLDGNATIGGNVPPSLMQTGSPEKLHEYCESLVDLFRGSAGYILTMGCGYETTTDEKVRIYLDSVKK